VSVCKCRAGAEKFVTPNSRIIHRRSTGNAEREAVVGPSSLVVGLDGWKKPTFYEKYCAGDFCDCGTQGRGAQKNIADSVKLIFLHCGTLIDGKSAAPQKNIVIEITETRFSQW